MKSTFAAAIAIASLASSVEAFWGTGHLLGKKLPLNDETLLI